MAGKALDAAGLQWRKTKLIYFGLFWSFGKNCALLHANPYRIVIRERGKGRWNNQGDGVKENFLCLLDESGWGQSREHARINGAAKQKLIGIS